MVYCNLRLFSSDAFFFTYVYVRVLNTRHNERVYVFWALRTYTCAKKTHHWKTALTRQMLFSLQALRSHTSQ